MIAISWRGRLKAIRLLGFENKRYFSAFWDAYGHAVEGLSKISRAVPAGRRIVMA